MIVEFLKEKMMEGIKDVVPERDWGNIDSFFEKVYVAKYDDEDDAYILGYWTKEMPLLAFDTERYEFLGVVMQDWVEEYGIQIV